VPRGTERLRITPTPFHDESHVRQLASALLDVWHELGLPLGLLAAAGPQLAQTVAAGG
jgi:5-aminolevulinate synthase